MPEAALISAHDLAVTLAGRKVLYGVSMQISANEIVTIVGPNGSGKSTLLRALVGAIQPSGGQISRHASLRIGYVPQRLDLDQSLPMTVGRFVALPSGARRTRISEVLAMVGLEDLATRQMSELSGGQFQRVLLARALVADPNLLVLDEPTQGLDQSGIARLYALIGKLRDTLGCAVLMVSHDLMVVMRESDRVICLNGHVCCEGSPTTVSAAPEYRRLFDAGTSEALALYRHHHDHAHDLSEHPQKTRPETAI